MATLDRHVSAERRSLAYHRSVARKLVEQPALLTKAVENLGRSPSGPQSRYVAIWRQLLDGPIEDLVVFLGSDSELAKDCRQASPFAGLLTPQERWSIWRDAR